MTIPDSSSLPDPTSTMADQAEKTAGNLADKAQCWLQKSRSCIEKHPVSCVLAAVAVGAFIGYLMYSKRSNQADTAV